jgi:hypothetical protein
LKENTNGGEARFLLFDDQKIRPLGGWEEVKRECLKSLYQPVLLLYELQDTSTPRASYSHVDVRAACEEGGSHHEPSPPSVLRQMFAEVDLATALSLSESHSNDLSESASVEENSHLPPMMAVKIFEVRFPTAYITLKYETTCRRRMLGFEHNLDEYGRVVIIGFMRHPDTGLIPVADWLSHDFLFCHS